MHNVLILGSGRSGTSMTASAFARSGAFMGDQMLAPTRANPRGYFEDHKLNVLNDDLIEKLLPWPPFKPALCRFVASAHLDRRGYWLAAPRRLRPVTLSEDLQQRMRYYAGKKPFCYKDPRFSVTLPLWEKLLPADTRKLVVFRDPQRTVDSILRDVEESYQPPIRITAAQAYESWLRTYERLLDFAKDQPHWMFVSYDSVISNIAVPAIEAFTAASLDTSGFDPAISRSRPASHGPAKIAQQCRELHQRLLDRAANDLSIEQPRLVA